MGIIAFAPVWATAACRSSSDAAASPRRIRVPNPRASTTILSVGVVSTGRQTPFRNAIEPHGPRSRDPPDYPHLSPACQRPAGGRSAGARRSTLIDRVPLVLKTRGDSALGRSRETLSPGYGLPARQNLPAMACPRGGISRLGSNCEEATAQLRGRSGSSVRGRRAVAVAFCAGNDRRNVAAWCAVWLRVWRRVRRG